MGLMHISQKNEEQNRMKNKERILYVLIAVLLVAVLVFGALFFRAAGQLSGMEKQVSTIEKTMKDTLAQVKAGEIQMETESGDVDDSYVDPEEEVTETPKPTKEPEEEGDSAADEFEDLQPQLEEMIQEYQASVGGEWSVYVEDLNTGGNMTIRDERMRAASLIKLFIMGAVYERYEDLKGKSDLDSLLEQMITVSDNDAANKLVEYLGDGNQGNGMAVVNAFCTQYNYTNTSMGRLLLQDNSISDNYTSVEDCGKFLYHVYNEKFEHSEDMLALLKAQTRRTKIPASIPDGIEVANKTGELDDVQNDVAIVFGDVPYIICIMSQGVSGEEGPVQAINNLSNAVYGYTNQT